jgi:ATP-binding protein involved in chromosome partitioning
MGFLADEEQAIMWRGLVLTRAVQQFLQDAHWGDLDYLLIDLPPGTGAPCSSAREPTAKP